MSITHGQEESKRMLEEIAKHRADLGPAEADLIEDASEALLVGLNSRSCNVNG